MTEQIPSSPSPSLSTASESPTGQDKAPHCPFIKRASCHSCHTVLTLGAAGLLLTGMLVGAAVEHAHSPSASVLPGENPTAMVSQAQAQVVIQKLTAQAGEVIKTFPGPAGLTGLVMKVTGKPALIGWMTNNQSAILIGSVVDTATNTNQTLRAMHDELLPQASPGNAATSALSGNAFGLSSQGGAGTPGATVAAPSSTPSASPQVGAAPTTYTLAQGNAALEGYLSHPYANLTLRQAGLNGPHTLYLFIDPNCIYCHQEYETIQQNLPALRKAGVSVQYVPVAFLKQSSLNMAVTLDQKGFTALQSNEAGFNTSTEQGGLPVQPLPSELSQMSAADARSVEAVHDNTETLEALSKKTNHAAAGTPTFLWMAGDGTPYIYPSFADAAHLKSIIASFTPGWTPPKGAK